MCITVQRGAPGAATLTLLEDQQLAGLIIWVPGGLAYARAALILGGIWIARSGSAGLMPRAR